MALEDPISPSAQGTLTNPGALSLSGNCAGDQMVPSQHQSEDIISSDVSKPDHSSIINVDNTNSDSNKKGNGGGDADGGDVLGGVSDEEHSNHEGSDTWSTPRDSTGDYGMSILGDWHGFRGRPIPDAGAMEFNRQLDHVGVWLEKWKHEEVKYRVSQMISWAKF